MPDRRACIDRRARIELPAPVPRQRERREEDRRDCPRRLIALDVREPGSPSRSCVGDLSVSGASFVTAAPPEGDLVELMFSVPTYTGPITATGCVVARSGLPQGTMVSVAFVDIDIDAQLAIAQWFDDISAAGSAATSPL
jgi:hypothetical protein